MGGAPLGHGNFSPSQAAMINRAAANMQARMENLTRHGNQDILNVGVRNVDTRSVASTAASRVQKAEWEQEYDRKDREVDEMIERHRQERERVSAEEQYGSDRDQADTGSDEGH